LNGLQLENKRNNGAASGADTKNNEPRILERTLKCCLLNGCVFWYGFKRDVFTDVL
jgi:hypothetical protein